MRRYSRINLHFICGLFVTFEYIRLNYFVIFSLVIENKNSESSMSHTCTDVSVYFEDINKCIYCLLQHMLSGDPLGIMKDKNIL